MKKSIFKFLCALFLITFLGLKMDAQTVDFVTPPPQCLQVVSQTPDHKITGEATVVFPDPIVTGGTATSFTWTFAENALNITGPVTKTVDANSTEEVSCTYTRAGLYIVTLKATFDNGTEDEISKSITIKPLPNAIFSFYHQDTVIACADKVIELKVTPERYNTTRILWSIDGDNGTNSGEVLRISPANPAINEDVWVPIGVVVYSTADNGDPCYIRSEAHVKFYSMPNIHTAQANYSIFRDESVMLEAQGGDTYLWTPSEGLNTNRAYNPIASPAQTTTYTVTGSVTHINFYPHPIINNPDLITFIGCASSTEVTVNVNVIEGNESTPIVATNILIPNSTENNAMTFISEEGAPCRVEWYKDCKLIIYNRWGQEVYVRDLIGINPNVWDGKDTNGNYLPDDTYYYLIKCENCYDKYCTNVKNNHTGAITILRKK